MDLICSIPIHFAGFEIVYFGRRRLKFALSGLMDLDTTGYCSEKTVLGNFATIVVALLGQILPIRTSLTRDNPLQVITIVSFSGCFLRRNQM